MDHLEVILLYIAVEKNFTLEAAEEEYIMEPEDPPEL